MHSTMEAWAEDLVEEIDEAVSSDQFQAWLDIQSHFHDYSYRNTLLITRQCPECENSPSYHERSDCEYDETPPEAWSKGLVGFRPAPIFDISQTEGEPLPELETDATGDADKLVPALLEGSIELTSMLR